MSAHDTTCRRAGLIRAPVRPVAEDRSIRAELGWTVQEIQNAAVARAASN